MIKQKLTQIRETPIKKSPMNKNQILDKMKRVKSNSEKVEYLERILDSTVLHPKTRKSVESVATQVFTQLAREYSNSDMMDPSKIVYCAKRSNSPDVAAKVVIGFAELGRWYGPYYRGNTYFEQAKELALYTTDHQEYLELVSRVELDMLDKAFPPKYESIKEWGFNGWSRSSYNNNYVPDGIVELKEKYFRAKKDFEEISSLRNQFKKNHSEADKLIAEESARVGMKEIAQIYALRYIESI